MSFALAGNTRSLNTSDSSRTIRNKQDNKQASYYNKIFFYYLFTQKTECPEETTEYTTVSACIQEHIVTFLLENDAILNVPFDIVQAALPKMKPGDIEDHLMMVCIPSVTPKSTSRGGAIVSVQFTSK